MRTSSQRASLWTLLKPTEGLFKGGNSGHGCTSAVARSLGRVEAEAVTDPVVDSSPYANWAPQCHQLSAVHKHLHSSDISTYEQPEKSIET
jgi:hypothetical protein